MRVEMFRAWQGFKKGDVVEMTEPLASCLEKKKIGKVVDEAENSKPSTTTKKKRTRKPRKRKKD